MRVIVAGLAALYPVGGVAWDYLQYAIGLHRLGHDVVYHEDTWSWPYDPVARTRTDDPAYSTGFVAGFFERYAPELAGQWHYRHIGESSHGMPAERFGSFAADADLYLNVSGASPIPAGLGAGCLTAFVDTDPGYNQIVLAERPDWSENVDRWVDSVRAHGRHLTYAENIHGPDCGVPTLDLEWTPTRMPVVPDLWADLPPPPADAAWTTVMTWDEFPGPLVHGGREYFSKGPPFERILSLPSRVDVPLGVAVGGRRAPVERLRESGWAVVDGPEATRTPESYRAFIAGSRGEVSTAKDVYVALKTGWFSTRSACYLAAGRPVVVEDTGFSRAVPTGEGLFAFTTAEEAREAIERVEAEPAAHRRAAADIAREHFGYDRVLGRLLNDLGFDGAG